MTALLLNDATLLDCTGADPRPHTSVLVEEGRISRIGPAGSIAAPKGARAIDASGRTLMPGLTDAHVHFGAVETGAQEGPQSHVSYVLKVAENIRLALDEGFTTVRDAGGLDPAYAVAVASGQILGPRILPSGSFLTITGGHGDHRSPWTDQAEHSIPGLVAHSEIVDGADAVRRAARTQLRRGATQVKLMVSGGVMSPNDPLESLQFSVPEIRAAVEEAQAFGKYVMAHAHTSQSMRNALDAGVRSLEHGSMLDEATAKLIVERGAFMVPTTVILELLMRWEGMADFSRQKAEMVKGRTAESVAMAHAAGAKIGSGSDLLGPRQRRRAAEIVTKARMLGTMEAIVSATRVNAELFGMQDQIGTVEAGKEADLILVDGNPLEDVGVLVDAANIPLVVKAGTIVKDKS
jgi:imidazolonepropionase-like amidohydrolase